MMSTITKYQLIMLVFTTYDSAMEWLNYHHLLYFWHVAREGGLTPAGRTLRVSHPTLSAQIKALERRLGAPLFRREGRRLALTDTGQMALRYADEIFSLGREMTRAIEGHGPGAPMRLVVGVTDAVPKLLVRRLLSPAFDVGRVDAPVRVVCHEGDVSRLLADLAAHRLDVVIADTPVPPGSPVRAFTHLLGESGISWLGPAALVERHRRRFPAGLDGAPVILPVESLPLRRALDAWFDAHQIRPRVVAECEDSALVKEFGAGGAGLFPAPTAIEQDLVRQLQVRVAGRVPSITERFYAITAERRLQHPAVVAISQAARQDVLTRQRKSISR